MKYVIFLWFTLFSLQLQSMLWKPLSAIEKQLIQKEIQKHGIETICKKVEDTPEPKLIENRSMCPSNYAVILHIQDTFDKNNRSTDSLTAAIFDKIEKREEKFGY